MKFVAGVLFVLILICEALETRHRNQVWRNDKSLWEDAILKSPGDGRAWMNAGLVYMQRGEYSRALSYFYMCDSVWPGYAVNKINLGIAHGALKHDDTAMGYFTEAIKLAPFNADAYHFEARWLLERGFCRDACSPECRLAHEQNSVAIRLSGRNPAASYLVLRDKIPGCRPE